MLPGLTDRLDQKVCVEMELQLLILILRLEPCDFSFGIVSFEKLKELEQGFFSLGATGRRNSQGCVSVSDNGIPYGLRHRAIHS